MVLLYHGLHGAVNWKLMQEVTAIRAVTYSMLEISGGGAILRRPPRRDAAFPLRECGQCHCAPGYG
jgi:hypothetical protein